MTVLEARKALRLTSGEFDDELGALIEAAMLDMETAGVARQASDELYEHAIRMYLRANFWPEGEVPEKCREIFEDLKGTMKLIERYREASA